MPEIGFAHILAEGLRKLRVHALGALRKLRVHAVGALRKLRVHALGALRKLRAQPTPRPSG